MIGRYRQSKLLQTYDRTLRKDGSTRESLRDPVMPIIKNIKKKKVNPSSQIISIERNRKLQNHHSQKIQQYKI